jgi:hypothetical protein
MSVPAKIGCSIDSCCGDVCDAIIAVIVFLAPIWHRFGTDLASRQVSPTSGIDRAGL